MSKLEHIVTVTAELDRAALVRQRQSLALYCPEQLTHWIVINELEPDLTSWQRDLEPLKGTHSLRIIAANTEKYQFTVRALAKHCDWGWQRQQIIKLDLHAEIGADYLVLDSKNFCIRPTSLRQWNTQTASGFRENLQAKGGGWLKTLKAYREFFAVAQNPRPWSMQTPYKFEYRILQDLYQQCPEIYNEIWNLPVWPSEFLLYSVYLESKQQSRNAEKLNHWTVWSKNSYEDFLNIRDKIYTKPDITVAGLHRDFIKKLSTEQRTAVNQWLTSLGLRPLGVTE